MPTDSHHTPTLIQPSTSQPQRKHKPKKPKRKNTEVPQPSGSIEHVADEAVNKEMDGSLERVATTATSLDAEQDRGGGPRCQETMGDTIVQTRFENVSKTSNDPLLAKGNTLRSGEDRLKLNELMKLCTKLQERLEKKGGLRTHKLKRIYRVDSSRRVESSKDKGLGDQEDASKQGSKIADIDKDAEIILTDETQGRYGDDMFDTGVQDDEEVFVGQDMTKKEVSTADPVTTAGEIVSTASVVATTVSAAATITPVEITLAQALADLKTAKPKAKGIAKQKMIELEKPLKKKDQILFDEEVALKLQAQLQAELEEEEKLARQKKEEANISLIESWDNIQAKIDADYQMAQ
ncbi:hypothetical protein Tco_0621664 [Tanacetum coccineum]